ncbi:DNA mismatch repair protein MutS [Candidatus Dojkabacteria bacterium]|nr:DNA mismatch repair protein MutS [Candidatus Dojkabacteria bacterium]
MQNLKVTPMMTQYQALKKQYKDKILLYRMGDFYETFGEDAEITARTLNIALTSRDKNDDPTPLAGFPHHALDQYLPKLVAAGYNVAVAEQTENPKQAIGIVKREVIRIVTPGTLTYERKGSENENNYLCSMFACKNIYGLACCDLSTGEFSITQSTDPQQIKNEIAKLNPAEVLVDNKNEWTEFNDYRLQILDDIKLEEDIAKEIVTNHFNVKSLSSLGINQYIQATTAAAMIIYYLKETQKTSIQHINKINYYDLNGTMILDYATIRNLDLISSTSETGTKGSLLATLDHTITSMGARKLRSWILHPLLEVKAIDNRLVLIEQFLEYPDILNQVIDQLKSISDLERLTGKIGLNRCNGKDLINLEESLENTLQLTSILKSDTKLAELAKNINHYQSKIKEIIKIISSSITDNPPNTIQEGNLIKDGYDESIDKIRSATKDSKDWIKSLQETERKRTGISSLKVKFNKVFNYYIEVTNTNKEKVPDNYIRKQTLVNAERYITPELKEKEDIVLNAEEKLATLEFDVFQQIRSKIASYSSIIQEVAKDISSIDAIASLSSVSRLNNYIKPEIYDFNENKGIIKIVNGRHPVVEQNSKESFVSNSTEMNTNDTRLVILTGPNMSGKSTYIRQIALIILMAQIGCFVPADQAQISIADRIFTRVGASDDLAAGRSTFMVEMDEAANIVNNATNHSFIVLDEIGRGTSTYDGVSIAWALAEYIHDQVKARCVFATHYHELLKLETELDSAKNFNIAVLEKDNQITFLRKIEQGGTDKSYGVYVAQMAGLPISVIDRAREILTGFEQEDMFGIRSTPNAYSKNKSKPENNEQNQQVNQTDQLSFGEGNIINGFPNIINELKSTDINNITPLKALQLIEKWKKRVGK